MKVTSMLVEMEEVLSWPAFTLMGSCFTAFDW